MPPFHVQISITVRWLCRCAISHSWQSHLPWLISTQYKGELSVWQLAPTLQQASPESGCSWQKAPLCGCRAVPVPVSGWSPAHVVTALALGICASREWHCPLLAVPLARKEAHCRRWWKKLLWQLHVLWEFHLHNRDHSVKFSRLPDVLSIPENKLISDPVLPFHLIALLSQDSWCQRDPWGLINLVWKEMFELSTSWMKRAQQIRTTLTIPASI